MLLESGQLREGSYASGLLEVCDEWLWLGIDRIGQRREGVLFRIVEESALLEEERSVSFAASLTSVSNIPRLGSMGTCTINIYLAYLRRAGIRDRHHLDQLCIFNFLRRCRCEECLEVNVPVGA